MIGQLTASKTAELSQMRIEMRSLGLVIRKWLAANKWAVQHETWLQFVESLTAMCSQMNGKLQGQTTVLKGLAVKWWWEGSTFNESWSRERCVLFVQTRMTVLDKWGGDSGEGKTEDTRKMWWPIAQGPWSPRSRRYQELRERDSSWEVREPDKQKINKKTKKK